ncbi:MAG: phosphonate metabolism protein/1,5-bisphosphokinase (PRPP-forming) PhnN, partial [Pseudomonadota bacterium]
SHGLDYALPASVEAQLAAGCTVVANVSRTIIASARAVFAPVCVILIDAPADVRLARLRRRGREAASDIEGRVARAVSEVTLGPGDTHIDNSGAPEAGVAQLIAAIEAATRAGRP